MRTHQGLKQWKCEHCEKSFQKYTNYKVHKSVKHFDEAEGQPEFICGVNDCGRIFNTKVKEHFVQFSFTYQQFLSSITQFLNQFDFKQEGIRVHIVYVHLGKKKVFPKKVCERCGKTFKDNHSLRMHTFSHTKESPYKCDICSKMFMSNSQLKDHKLRHEGAKNFICSTCGQRKATRRDLRVHMKYHIENEFPCNLCSKVFSRPTNMKRHIKVVHCGVKAYPCTYCDQSFGKAETLKHHTMTHTGERPLACSLCDRRFIQSVALKKHMNTHNKIK